MLPGRCLALPGFLFRSRFSCGPEISAFFKLKILEKIDFHLEMLPGPTSVVVTCLPSPPSGKDLSSVFGGKMYRQTGDAEADKATVDMAKEMGNLRKELDELEKNGKGIDIKCNKCGKNFIHSVPDQVWF